MHIKRIVVSPFETNCYLVWNKSDNTCVIIDPGDEDQIIIDKINQQGLKPKAILLTHGHADHIAAVEPLKEKFEIPLYLGKGDEVLLDSSSSYISSVLGYKIKCPFPDHLISDADVIDFGSLKFTVLATPGHTPGGVCYLDGKHLFCGDTLFSGSIGRTDLPGGNFQQLIDSINRSILTLPEDIICYPGHGPETTVGEEKNSNPFLMGRFV
jgi:glyoxylase-like metal-dependent hydrolase (beta-lactamase superfamily II)